MAWSYKDFEKGKETNSWDTKRQEAEQAIANLGDFKYNTYTPSDAVNNYQQQLQNHEANKVADWTGGTHGATLNDILNQINNREKFSYDLNGDALYQQYKDQYINTGRLAMQDTIGQASAMTGGYGNSYAATAGNQAYQSHLQQLNDRVPELYQMALNKYNMEGDQLLNQYNVTSDAYNKEYGVHRDAVADWENQRSYLQTALNNERNWDYGQFSDAEERRLKEYDIAYGKLQDSLNRADTNYWSSYGQDYTMYNADRNQSYTEYQDGIANNIAWYNAETARINANKTTGGGGGGNGGGGDDGGGVTPTKTKNTDTFQASIKTKHEFLIRGGRAKDYANYVDGKIGEWYEAGKLSDEEAAYLVSYYGLN